jgi:iron(III) transport system substrate-binding protein
MRNVILVGLALLLAACGGTAAPASSGAASGKPAQSALSGEAKTKWDNLVAAAKKEGKVVLSVGPGGGAQARQVLPPAFKEDFGIDLEVIVAPSTQTVERLKLERSSGIHSVDVVIGGSDTMYLSFYGEKLIAPFKQLLIHPDVTNGANWTNGKPWFMDPEEEYILRLSNGVTGHTAVNTKLVQSSELTSSQDLLKPQFKGKLAGFDWTINGSGAQHAVFLYIKLGQDYVKKLYVDQQPVKTQDNRQLGDWVGRGNYPVAIAMNSATLEQLKQDGLPVQHVPPFKDVGQYVTAGSGLMAMIKDPPHPAATQLFLNWMAMPKAQIAYNKTVQQGSVLTTVKDDWLPDYLIPKQGVEYFDLYGWEYTTKTYPAVFETIRKLSGA